MDIKDAGVFLGTAATVLWILKVIGEKLIANYIETKKRNEDLRDSFLTEKINWLGKSIDSLKVSIDMNSAESIKHKIMMQGLSHEIAALRAEYKSEGASSKKSLELLAKVLSHINSQLKVQGAEIESLGKIIIRMPEGK